MSLPRYVVRLGDRMQVVRKAREMESLNFANGELDWGREKNIEMDIAN